MSDIILPSAERFVSAIHPVFCSVMLLSNLNIAVTMTSEAFWSSIRRRNVAEGSERDAQVNSREVPNIKMLNPEK